MTRKKLPEHKTKVHITATVSRECVEAIKGYRHDPKNEIDGEKPSRSQVIQKSIIAFTSK